MIIWLNGGLIDGAPSSINPADRGFTLGDGLFETMAMKHSTVARLDAHRKRLEKGCEVLGLPFPSVDLKVEIARLSDANHFTEATIRLTLTRGITARGLAPPGNPNPTLLITASSLPGAPPPARCIISKVTRRNERSPLSRIKSLNYLDNILARREAVKEGANEAILLNTRGQVAETTVANIFIVKNNSVFTPPIEDGALPGIMREAVMAAYPIIERSLSTEDVLTADGVFLTNSLGIRTLASIDGKTCANAARAFMEDVMAKLAL